MPQRARARSLHKHVMCLARAHHALHYHQYLEQTKGTQRPVQRAICRIQSRALKSRTCSTLAARLSRPVVLLTLQTHPLSHTDKGSPCVTDAGGPGASRRPWKTYARSASRWNDENGGLPAKDASAASREANRRRRRSASCCMCCELPLRQGRTYGMAGKIYIYIWHGGTTRSAFLHTT